MAELGIEPKRSLGQNFLVSDSVVEKILMAAQPKDFVQTFEIGPGLGALTDLLAAQAQNIQLIELDRTFAEYWRTKEMQVHEMDALKFSWSGLDWAEGPHLLVSNLPYQISSRLVVDLSVCEPSFSRMVLMFQKEVAQRLLAAPKSSDYGLLTVVAQAFWRPRLVVEAGAVDFMPKPNVASRVVCFDRRPSPLRNSERRDFLSFVKMSFANRRKKLLPKLTSFQDKARLAELFEITGVSVDCRAETLSPQQFIDLYFALKKEY